MNDYYRDRPRYYVLDEQGEALPIGQGYLLSVEEMARWHTLLNDPAARTGAETLVANPMHPTHPVVVRTSFAAEDCSITQPLPDGAPAVWLTTLLLEEPRADDTGDAWEEDDDAWMLEDHALLSPEELALADRLGLDGAAFYGWTRVYGTRAEALRGHAATVRWVRRALGIF